MFAYRSSSTALSDRDLLARLIAFDSTSIHSNAPIADFLADYLESGGCRVLRLPGRLHEMPNGPEKVNLLAWRGPATDGGLLLSGHLDVVPATEGGWESDPFALVEREERLFGRGTTDMKGFVALAANRLRAAREDDLVAPLALLLTADEELGSLGAQRFVQDWDNAAPLPRSALIGEPTSLRIVRMHKGHLKLRLTIVGKAAHSGLPQQGENAIEHAGVVITELTALATTWQSLRTEVSDHFPECPHPVLNLGVIQGGSAVNIVPDRVTLDIGLRLLPGQNSETAITEVKALIEALPADVAAAVAVEMINDSPPMLCPKSAPINIELARLLRQCATCGVSFASDAGTLQKVGVQSVLFGPGTMDDAHQANESLAIAQFVAAGEWLEQIIPRFCAARAT